MPYRFANWLYLHIPVIMGRASFIRFVAGHKTKSYLEGVAVGKNLGWEEATYHYQVLDMTSLHKVN